MERLHTAWQPRKYQERDAGQVWEGDDLLSNLDPCLEHCPISPSAATDDALPPTSWENGSLRDFSSSREYSSTRESGPGMVSTGDLPLLEDDEFKLEELPEAAPRRAAIGWRDFKADQSIADEAESPDHDVHSWREMQEGRKVHDLEMQLQLMKCERDKLAMQVQVLQLRQELSARDSKQQSPLPPQGSRGNGFEEEEPSMPAHGDPGVLEAWTRPSPPPSRTFPKAAAKKGGFLLASLRSEAKSSASDAAAPTRSLGFTPQSDPHGVTGTIMPRVRSEPMPPILPRVPGIPVRKEHCSSAALKEPVNGKPTLTPVLPRRSFTDTHMAASNPESPLEALLPTPPKSPCSNPSPRPLPTPPKTPPIEEEIPQQTPTPPKGPPSDRSPRKCLASVPFGTTERMQPRQVRFDEEVEHRDGPRKPREAIPRECLPMWMRCSSERTSTRPSQP